MNVKKRKLSPPAAMAVVVSVALVVLVAGLFALVLPQRDKASSLAKEIASTKDEIATARALSEQKPAQPIRVANLFKLVKAMPDQVDMTGIILQLQQTATDAGIEFDSIQPVTPQPGASFTVVPINLSFNGNYYSLTDFLFRLRNLVAVRGGALSATGRLFSVGTLDFGPGAVGFPSVSARLTVDAFVYGTSAVPSAAPAATSTETTPTLPTPPSPAVASGATS